MTVSLGLERFPLSWKSRCGVSRSATPSPLPRSLPRVGIVAGFFRDADGDARQIEGLAQAIGEKALVTRGQSIELIAEKDEIRRPRAELGHVADFDAPPSDRGRRGLFEGGRKPAIEPRRRNPFVPDFMDTENRLDQC